MQATATNVNDLTPAADLLHGEETVVYAAADYQGNVKGKERRWMALRSASVW